MREYLEATMIIPTYNRLYSLLETINSLLKGNSLPLQLIIVDQSTDFIEHKNQLEDLLGKTRIELFFLHSDYPSATHARNIGIDAAKFDILIFSDDDIDYERETIKNIYDYMIQDEYSLVASLDKRMPKNKKILPYVFCTRSFIKRKIGHVSYGVYGRYPDPDTVKHETKTEWAMGFLFSVKKSNLEKWNINFDEKLSAYSYGEDLLFSTEYCKKSFDEGKFCVITPKVKVNHMCSREWRISSDTQNFILVVNRYYIMSKLFTDDIRYLLAFYWSNLGLFVQKIIKNDNPKAFASACIYCLFNSGKIKRGVFDTYDKN